MQLGLLGRVGSGFSRWAFARIGRDVGDCGCGDRQIRRRGRCRAVKLYSTAVSQHGIRFPSIHCPTILLYLYQFCSFLTIFVLDLLSSVMGAV